MLLYIIGMFVVGLITVNRGKKTLEQAAQCQDEEERTALKRLGARRQRLGQIIMIASGCAFFAALLFFAWALSI